MANIKLDGMTHDLGALTKKERKRMTINGRKVLFYLYIFEKGTLTSFRKL